MRTLHSGTQKPQCACSDACRLPKRVAAVANHHLRRPQFDRCHAAPKDAEIPSQSNVSRSVSQNQQGKSNSGITPAEYMAPFSAVDPAMRSDVTSSSVEQSSSSSSETNVNLPDQQQGASSDKWGEVLAVNHTLSSLYLRKVKVQPFQQLDLAERRRKRELQEMCQAAAKMGIKADVIEQNLARLQSLVPGLHPNLDQMKASDWATILKDVDRVVAIVITLKTFYPKVDVGRLLQRTPKLLLKPVERIQADAQQVKSMLAKVSDIDAIIEAVPYLMNPNELQQSIGNLARWFPNQDPYDVLQNNPTVLVNVEEADLEADPLYGADIGLLD